MSELLRVEGITKIFGQHKVLDGVSFSLRAGEVHCLIGENGAGKSTLIKILSGALTPNAGIIMMDGKSYTGLTPKESMELGISTIYQDVQLIDSLTVADNIFLGNEKSNFTVMVDTKKQNKKAREIMDRLKINIDETLLVEELSAAQKQTLQIVKAIHGKARILIMDEPTSSLGVEEKKALMSMVKELKEQGVGIIYISHYLEEIFQIGDEITILKDGHHVGTYPVSEVDTGMVIRKMVGRDAALFYEREQVEKGEGILQVCNYSWGDTVKDVSFTVQQGEIFGIGGLVGAGRSELASLIFGIEKKDAGKLLLNGKELSISCPREALEQGICLITEDRKMYALFIDRSVKENIVIVANEIENSPLLKKTKENSQVEEMVQKLHIALADMEQPVGDLSGGNQQKTVIARWMLSGGRVFIFDEPSKGVDIGAREEIYKLMVGLAREGNYIIMISSDMPELLSMSDRIGVMREGRMTYILGRVPEEELIKYFLGAQ